MKNAATLSPDYEYAIIHWGQSNAAPQGTAASFFGAAPHLSLRSAGGALTLVVPYVDAGGGLFQIAVAEQLTAGQWTGATLRLTVSSSVGTLVVGYGTVEACTAYVPAVVSPPTPAVPAYLYVRWAVAPAADTTGGWVVLEDQWRSYPNVRMLTAYLPEEPGGYPEGDAEVPGYDFTGLTYEDAGLFLPWTVKEGVAGPGTTGTGHGSTAPTATTFTAAAALKKPDGTAGAASNLYAGGILLVGTSYARIASHDNAGVVTLDSDGWVGGTPAVGQAYEIHVPHYDDNPYHRLRGFRYPNNHSQPSGSLLGQLKNVPAEVTTGKYGESIGETLSLASKLSATLGVRINVIHLATGATGQLLRMTSDVATNGYEFGWFNRHLSHDWTPGNPNNLANRLKRMVTVMAPAALVAEGNTKPLRILAIRGSQGETDAGQPEGRALFRHTLPRFYAWLRDLIVEAGLSAYPRNVKIPVVHNEILPIWESTILPDLDTEGLVNQAILDFAAKDLAAASFNTDDVPVGTGNDYIHYTGAGQVENASRAVAALLPLINRAVRMSVTDNGADVEIANLALSHLGDSARVTALDGTDTMAQAELCRQFYPLALQTLLEAFQWKFATRRVSLVEVTNDRTEWQYAYALPGDMQTAIAVVPTNAIDDMVDVPQGSFSTGTPLQQTVNRDFVIEIDEDGYQVLRTNQEDAVLRYQALVTDASQYPASFKLALSWQLASMLAGPILKGSAGEQAGLRAAQMARAYVQQSAAQDGGQRQITKRPAPKWINARGF